MMNTMHTTTTHPPHVDDHLEPRQPAQLPVGKTENSPTYGELMGNPPITFDGDRSNSDPFITQFGLFRIINDGNPVITNPIQRIALALNYIRGPKVQAWVTHQYDALLIKVNHTRTHADMDESLWEDFIAEFKRAFAEPAWKVLSRLEKLQMAGDDLEMYIATFENLVRRAERQRESVTMVQNFLQGLPIDFVRSIVKQQATPNTIDEWQSAARNEAETRALMKLYHPERDTDAAQTGVTRLARLSEGQKAWFMAEGRCFKCSEKGHRARDCPDPPPELEENYEN
jgi:hypothetical protein